MSPSLQDKIDKWFLTLDGNGDVTRERHQWNAGNGKIDSNVRDYARADVTPVIEGANYMKKWHDGLKQVGKTLNAKQGRAYHAGWKMTNVETLGAHRSGSTPEELIKATLPFRNNGKFFMLLSGHLWFSTYVPNSDGGNPNSEFLDDFGGVNQPKGLNLRNTLAMDYRYGSGQSLHQKFTIFRTNSGDSALVGSIDIDHSRYGRKAHEPPDDPQRPDDPGRPDHEVGVEITGDTVNDIEWEFIQRFNDNSPGTTEGPQSSSSNPKPIPQSFYPGAAQNPTGTQRVQVLNTYGKGNEYSWDSDFTCWAAYLNAIQNVSDYVYLEGQFFSPLGWNHGSDPPGRFFENPSLHGISLFYMLRQAMKRGAHVLVVVPHPDTLIEGAGSYSVSGYKGEIYSHIINRRHKGIRWLRSEAQDLPGEFNIAYLKKKDTYIYVHSKVMICDDVLSVVGSTNFGQRSMTSDAELSVAILDKNDEFTTNLRDELWGEHAQASISKASAFASAIKSGTGRLEPYQSNPKVDHDIADSLVGKIDPYNGP